MQNLYTCPCCGYLVHTEPPGSDNICPICFWQDDAIDLWLFEQPNGPNKVSLIQGQKNFATFGVSEVRLREYVRAPLPNEQRDHMWRVIDPKRDFVLKTPPQDDTQLYYWRKYTLQ
jgi:Cysteine-rich CPCC